MLSKILAALAIVCMFSVAGWAGEASHQSTLNPAQSQAAKKYPAIVLYSVAWCPHCKEAKEYFTRNNIPFINHDVEVDAKAMEELTGKYKSRGVPLIVIEPGKNEIVVRGFSPAQFEDALKKAPSRK